MTILLSLAVYVLIAAVIWWGLTMLPIPAPLLKILQVVLVVVILLLVIGLLTGNSLGLPALR